MEKKDKQGPVLLILSIVAALLPITVVGLWNYQKQLFSAETIISSVISVCGSISASLLAMYFIRRFLNNDIVELEERFIGSIKAMTAIGIEDIAMRGGDGFPNRSGLPSHMINSSKSEFFMLAFSGMDTLLTFEKQLKKKLKSCSIFKVGFLLLDPNSETAKNWKIHDESNPNRTVRSDTLVAIECLKRLSTGAKNRVTLKTYTTLPTLTATAIDAEIIGTMSGAGLIGIQPRIEGEISHGIVLDITQKEGGIWGTMRKSLMDYWNDPKVKTYNL